MQQAMTMTMSATARWIDTGAQVLTWLDEWSSQS